MMVSYGACAFRAARTPVLRLASIAGALALAACSHSGTADFAAMQLRGASVAFESIDGPPPAQFQTLVRSLNDEAQTRRLAVMSRESPSAYRVRGYLAAKGEKGRTTISWVWDVFDRDEHRAFRIEGEELTKDGVKGARDAWNAADEGLMRRIAHDSMERLASFLTSPDAAPDAAPTAVQTALTLPNDNSPEAAGIFRLFRAEADPLPATAPADGGDRAGDVPLPPQRPRTHEALAPAEKITVATSAL